MDDVSDDESDSDDDDDDNGGQPLLSYKFVEHDGGVNRVRVMPSDTAHIAATWSDTGRVHVWDVAPLVAQLDSPSAAKPSPASRLPVYSNTKHATEGYALDWSSRVTGRLLSGDCHGNILQTHMNSGSQWQTDAQAFSSHTASVEDLQ